MLKASEILLETIKKDGRPERLLRQYEGATFYPPNPANNYVRGNRHRGMEPMKDLFGTEILWPCRVRKKRKTAVHIVRAICAAVFLLDQVSPLLIPVPEHP